MDPYSVLECLWFGCVAFSCVGFFGSVALVVLLSRALAMAANVFRACHGSPSGLFFVFPSPSFCRFSVVVNCHLTLLEIPLCSSVSMSLNAPSICASSIRVRIGRFELGV